MARKSDSSDQGHPEVAFPATRWTLVGRAGGEDEATYRAALAELVRAYSPALRAHLLQTLRYDEHRADDLLQGFLAGKVLEQRLIGHADPKRGRFRTFLLAALQRYIIDEHRHNTAAKRAPRNATFDIDDHRDTLPHETANDAFDAVWARQVLGEVLAAMKKQCDESDRADLWDVFVVRYLNPATEDVEPEPHESIAKRLKLKSAHDAANLLISAKRMFTRVFKTVVARYAADEKELKEEVSELWRVFSSGKR